MGQRWPIIWHAAGVLRPHEYALAGGKIVQLWTFYFVSLSKMNDMNEKRHRGREGGSLFRDVRAGGPETERCRHVRRSSALSD